MFNITDPINIIDYKELIKIILVISVEVVGVVQWTKNFKRDANNKIKRIRYTRTNLFLCFLFSTLHTTLVPKIIVYIIDMFLLSLAVTQLAWDVIVKGIPKIVGNLIDQVFKLKVNNKGDYEDQILVKGE